MQEVPIEWSQPGDVYKDFRVMDYEPVGPTEGRIRSASLLYASFAAFDLLDRGLELVDAMRSRFGVFATGWGFKLRTEGPTWEFYWYNEQEEPRTKSVAHLAEVLEPFGGLKLDVDPMIPYASFSLDLDELLVGSNGASWLNLYFGRGVDSRCPGFSYRATAEELVLQNAYFVARPTDSSEMRELRHRMLFSSRNGSSAAVDALLETIPSQCRYAYFVHKPRCDAFYYSETDLAFFLNFIDWANLPETFRDFVTERQGQLDHLRWDTGFNFVITDDEIKVLKVGVYGYV